MPIAPFSWPENPSAAQNPRQRIRVATWPDGTTFFDTTFGRLSEADARAISAAYMELQQRRAEAAAKEAE